MPHRRALVTVSVLVGVSVLAGSCSSASQGKPRSPTSAQASAPVTSASSTATADTAAAYVGTVNALCDALLPKVIAVTHGGSLDVPVREYLAQLPAHTELLTDFDRDLAAIPVPPAAQGKANAFHAYVRYANQLDARRLAAARQGEGAYAKEIHAEQGSTAGDAVTAARTAAGFNSSCDAR